MHGQPATHFPSKGWLPKKSRKSMTESENRSLSLSGVPPVTTSGAM